jgi:hypothetical protein
MSPDEGFVTVTSIVVGPVLWVWTLFRFSRIEALGRPVAETVRFVAVVVMACAAGIAAVLVTAASHDVRDSGPYLFMYLVLGLAWMRVASVTFAYAGLSARDDLVERANGAARPAIAGALVGVACCYAGGNIGDGPGWWVVVFSAALATMAFLASWIALDRLAAANDAVTVDRDPASGVRLGAYLAATGVILGRSVAGDWISAPVTVADFIATAWPVLPLLGVAVAIERMMRPTPANPRPSVAGAGVLPGLVYLAAAAAYVFMLGWPAPE